MVTDLWVSLWSLVNTPGVVFYYSFTNQNNRASKWLFKAPTCLFPILWYKQNNTAWLPSWLAEMWALAEITKDKFSFPQSLVAKNRADFLILTNNTQIFKKRQIWSEISWRSISLKITLECLHHQNHEIMKGTLEEKELRSKKSVKVEYKIGE